MQDVRKKALGQAGWPSQWLCPWSATKEHPLPAGWGVRSWISQVLLRPWGLAPDPPNLSKVITKVNGIQEGNTRALPSAQAPQSSLGVKLSSQSIRVSGGCSAHMLPLLANTPISRYLPCP